MVIPAHEAWDADFQPRLADLKARLAKAKHDLPSRYHEHKVVVDNLGETVFPGAVFVDGVAYDNSDTCIDFWLLCLLTGRRILCVVLRKKSLCRCGCRGWCTLYSIFSYLSYCLASLAAGRHPLARHD